MFLQTDSPRGKIRFTRTPHRPLRSSAVTKLYEFRKPKARGNAKCEIEITSHFSTRESVSERVSFTTLFARRMQNACLPRNVSPEPSWQSNPIKKNIRHGRTHHTPKRQTKGKRWAATRQSDKTHRSILASQQKGSNIDGYLFVCAAKIAVRFVCESTV